MSLGSVALEHGHLFGDENAVYCGNAKHSVRLMLIFSLTEVVA